VKWLMSFVLVLVLLGCAGIQTKPHKFDLTFRYTPGVKGQIANVGEPYHLGLFFTGMLPDTPVCIEFSFENEPFSLACSYISQRYITTTIIVPLSEYLLRNPRPYDQKLLRVGESDTILPYLVSDASQDETPRFKIRVRVYEAAVDHYGTLVPLRKVLLCKRTRSIRLACKRCTW